MKLCYIDNLYVFECEFIERLTPSNAGFKWHLGEKCKRRSCPACDAGLGKAWYTTSDNIAAELINFADESAHEQLFLDAKAKEETLAASWATDAEIDIPCPNSLSFLPYQRAGVAFGDARPGVLIGDEMGLGKAQSLDADVLTPTGYTSMRNIWAGDKVINSQGGVSTVTGVFTQGKKDMFRVIFNDGASTECCDDHLWMVNTANGRYSNKPYKVLPLKEIRKRITDKSGNSLHFVPIISPVDFPEKTLPLHPYLLGALLGDGGLSARAANITNPEPQILGKIDQLLPAGHRLKHATRYTYRIVTDPPNYQKGSNKVVAAIKKMGLNCTAEHKFIPTGYKLGSIKQRVQILQGLMDTDGYCMDQVKCTVTQYSTASEQLANDICFIVQSLGGIARKSIKQSPKYTYKGEKKIGLPAHILTLNLPEWLNPFTLSRKADIYKPNGKYKPSRAIKKIEYIGKKEAQCISVDAPDRLYVTNDFILTHNTVQAIGLANLHPEYRKILIICPANLKINWYRELKRWLVDDYMISICNTKYPFPKYSNIVIINYDILHRYEKQLRAHTWDLLVIDEAHYIRNRKSRRSKAVYGYKKKSGKESVTIPPIPAGKKVLLTGTPIENYPKDLYALVNYLDPENWPSEAEFMRQYYEWEYKKVFRKGCKGIPTQVRSFTKPRNLESLQKKLRSTIMIRRLKKDVLAELPAKRRQIIELPANGHQQLLRLESQAFNKYEAAQQKRQSFKTSNVYGNENDYRQHVKEMRNSEQLLFSELSSLRQQVALEKIPLAIPHIESAIESSGKVVLFAYHRSVIQSLRDHFGSDAVLLYGGMTASNKQESIDNFQHGNAKLFIGSVANAEGYTLTSSSHVIFMELDWLPGKMLQAEDRCHRVGQQNAVLVQHLIFEGSLDVKIASRLIEKQEYMEAALDDVEVA